MCKPLENRIEQLRDAAQQAYETNLSQGSDIKALFERTNNQREQLAELSEFAQATVPRVEAAATNSDLEALADRTARGLAHLAVAITELRRPTLRARIVAWLRANVYSGTPIFTHTPFDQRWL
jgi:hypothetical protein